MKLYISTFGGFDVKANNQSVLKKSSRTYKLYKLFEYFITFKNKKILPETIIDNLWSDSESADPKNVLRTQIFRLRQIIDAFYLKDEDEKDYLSIKFINGYYCLETGKNAILDLDEFEDLISQGDLVCNNDTESAITFYVNALDLYKGLYLSDNPYEVWIAPARNYYQRLYIKTLYKLIDLLNEKNDNESIIELCEKSLLLEPYEENIHISLIEAMTKLGKTKGAKDHYIYAVNFLEKEMNIKPSNKFLNSLDKIQNNVMQENDINFTHITEKLEFVESPGAINCDIEHFKFLFNIQRGKALRNNENDYISIITLVGVEDQYKSLEESSRLTSDLSRLLMFSLRKGDIFTFWNENQILIMFHNVIEEGIKSIEERIRNNLNKYTKISNKNLHIDFQPLIKDNLLK